MEKPINYWYQKYLKEKLTWEDIDLIQQLYVEVMTEAGGTPMDFAEETLRRFNELRKK